MKYLTTAIATAALMSLSACGEGGEREAAREGEGIAAEGEGVLVGEGVTEGEGIAAGEGAGLEGAGEGIVREGEAVAAEGEAVLEGAVTEGE